VVRVSRDTSIEGIALTQEVTIPGLNTQTVALWQMDALPEPLRGGYIEPVCTENPIRVDGALESPKLAE